MIGVRCLHYLLVGLISSIALAVGPAGPAYASLITVDGCQGGQIGPANGGLAVANCTVLAGTGTFSGTVTENVTAFRDILTVSGVFTGSGSITVSNHYPNSLSGFGLLFALLDGQLAGTEPNPQISFGREFFQLVVTATTFNNNSATARYDAPADQILPLSVTDYDERFGYYTPSAGGILTGVLTWDLGDNEEFRFPASVDFVARANEPASGLLLIFMTGVLFILWRRRNSKTPSQR